MTPKEKQSSAWIFVSHSHRDLEKVRQIRNYLEKHGANPLLFFLKCLSDDDARLPELISDEIIARNWFVLCDSQDARNSNWVQQEKALVLEHEGKGFETIDLEQDLESQYYKLDRICKRATVFISYSRQDVLIADQIREKLIQNDYSVWTDETSGSICSDRSNEIHSSIDKAVKRGFVLVLLSPSSIKSQWCNSETEYALELASKSGKTNIVPVVISPIESGLLPTQLANVQWFDLTMGSFEQRIQELITLLKDQEIQ